MLGSIVTARQLRGRWVNPSRREMGAVDDAMLEKANR
jgi:hypothetical protein